ncbi:hypothetical protein [Marilutibacter chinensis]|uniref:Uncharacterized protein n=1 Tax=Marilutibacter chinensis TaxID=2912247 RepID=A0ABS9HXN3_9GAMM|nr:hypothetical protein [Lysobacter chinensis]MCF7223644.1 hypothetical protein [Lysobacter chinensis]
MSRSVRWWRNFQQGLNAAAISMARGAHALVPAGVISPVAPVRRSRHGGRVWLAQSAGAGLEGGAS